MKPYFIRAERCFEGIFDDFLRYRKWWKCWFFKVLPNSVSNSKWGSRCGWKRYAPFGNRTLVLKCKPTGDAYRTNVLKYTIIVQYYSIFFVQLVFCTFLQVILYLALCLYFDYIIPDYSNKYNKNFICSCYIRSYYRINIYSFGIAVIEYIDKHLCINIQK